MSSYRESFNASINGNSIAGSLPEEFAQSYPTLATVLCGEPATEACPKGVPPGTVSIFSDGGKLKFCISPKIGANIAFGCFSDPVKGLDDLELQLSQGRFEWRRGSKRTSS
jgi:hypothetical protein